MENKKVSVCTGCKYFAVCGDIDRVEPCKGYQEKSFNISDIESLSYSEAVAMCEEIVNINGHEVFLIDFSGAFGFSAVVFRDKHHLYYANDYQLHHASMTRDQLKDWYMQTMNNKLFSDDMLLSPITDYSDKTNRIAYLNNYYPLMCDDKISAFNIFHNDAEREEFKKKVENLFYCQVGFFYTSNPAFIRRLEKLYAGVIKASENAKNSREYWFNAFKYEMYNHEYAINWQGDWDVCSCFCKCEYGDSKTGSDYLSEAGFNPDVISAYYDARKAVLSNSDY